MSEPALTPAQAVTRAINHNTRAILALARLVSERLPAAEPVRSVVTQEQSEAAYRARMGVYEEDDGPREPTDRELIEHGLRLARIRSERVGHERQG